jgi:shikimate 5-dehydrogenase
VAGTWDVLVNATPVGTWPDVDALPFEASFVQGPVVYDLVYNPAQTALLRAATARGSRTIGGLEMLVAQAIRQFEWWTGQSPPPGVMEAAARRRLEEFRDEPVRTLAEG